MPASSDQGAAEVYEGRGVELHVAPEGIALTRCGVAPPDDAARFAEFAQVKGVSLAGRVRVALLLEFHDGRPAWRVPGMRRSHAEWARHDIERYATRASRRALPLFARKLPLDQLGKDLAALLQESPVDICAISEALLTQAALHQASDLHLTPGAADLVLRWRVDGIVAEVGRLERGVGERVVARLKVLGGMATYAHDAIQEGRARLDAASPVELRLTVLPSLHGEAATVRILDPACGLIPLADLGFEPADLATYQEALAAPEGAIVLTGPAGAGKTTTMYASLRALDEMHQGGWSVATVEDPAEYDLGFATQTEVRPAAGVTFATALRAVLRQDPNALMVGEVRDAETAEIAVRAGMTGHLVLTTLHAAGPAGVFPRLAEMGIAPFLATSAVRCIVAQRLLRRLCSCAVPDQPDEPTLAALGLTADEVAGWTLRRPQGCAACEGTGHVGRTGVFEVTPVTDALRELAMASASAPQIRAALREAGAPDLRGRALEKARRGEVALAEVLRVLGRDR